MSGGKAGPWHWRQAMQIAAQVPPEEIDAWLVLDCVRMIVELSFNSTPPPDPPAGGGGPQLLRFPGGSKSPSRRANSIGRPSGLPK
jgi:hypothetical protein